MPREELLVRRDDRLAGAQCLDHEISCRVHPAHRLDDDVDVGVDDEGSDVAVDQGRIDAGPLLAGVPDGDRHDLEVDAGAAADVGPLFGHELDERGADRAASEDPEPDRLPRMHPRDASGSLLPAVDAGHSLTLLALFITVPFMSSLGPPTPAASPPLALEYVLGRGRHGCIYRATTPAGRARRPVAVKVPASPEVHDRERRALARLQHPGIVAMVGEANGALVLELAGRGSLQDHLDGRGCLTCAEVAGVVAALVDALEFVHGEGWIHGDVNPTNIGVRDDGSVMLLDLATARPSDAVGIAETTPAFAGPSACAGPAMDLRATAATALACLADEETERRGHLAALIGALDAGRARSGSDLRSVFEAVSPTPIRPGPVGGRRGRGSTIEFGPRPRHPVPDPAPQPRRPHPYLPALVAVGVVVLALVAIAWPSPPAENAERAGPAADTLVTADASLADHDVHWDAATATVVGPGGSRWRVGSEGDIAAAGDWNCDGRATLGIYRPTTAEWFAFASWRPGELSVPPVVLERGSGLAVRRSPTDCDEPVPLD